MQTPLAQTALPSGAHTNQASPTPQSNRQAQAPAPKLTLEIRDLLGRPVPELQLGTIDLTHWRSMDFETRTPIESLGATDDQGHLASLPFQHNCSIVSLNPNWLIVEDSSVLENTNGVRRLLARRGGSIYGVIMGDQGPVAGALVSALVSNEFLTLGKAARDEAKRTGPKPALFDPANPRQTVTDANGRFELGGLLASSTRLFAIADGYVPLQFEFQGKGPDKFTDVGSFTLKHGVSATVRVHLNSSSVPSGRLFLERSDDSFSRGMQGIPIDLHGEVHLPDMATGEYKWIIERDDTLAVWGKLKIAKAGEVISISLPRTERKRVIVQDASGLSIPGLTVKASELGKHYRKLQGDGHVQFQCGLGSTVKLGVHAKGYASSAGLQIPADQNEFVVQLRKLGGLQLSGLTGFQKILAAALPDRQKDKLLLLNISHSPVSLKPHPVHAGQLTLTDLEPGQNWVIVDVGGGCMALGPFDINEGKITQAQATLPQSRPLEINVRDSVTGLALTGVSLQLVSNDLIPQGKISYLMDFLGPSDHELATGINGSAILRLRATPDLSLRLSKEGFESKFVAGSELKAAGPSLLLNLQSLPSSNFWVEFQAGQPASDAHVYFSKGPESTSSPAGRLRTDAAGKGLCEAIVPGRLNASIRYERTESVTYHIRWPRIEVQPEQTTYICLLPKSAQISLSNDMLRGAKSFSLRRTPDRTCSKFQVTWGQQAGEAPPQQVQVIPGKYQIEVLGSGPPRYGRVRVASGESVLVTRETKLYGLAIETTGADCETATFHLRNMAGPYRDVSRSEHLQAPDPLLVKSLPAGLYRVSLTGWTHQTSGRQQSTQTQFVVIGEQGAHVIFPLPPPATNAD
ncbi:MAG: hypothetical protein JKY61_10710 [Planctomycetes bacterium]|nr:hypothetical protein [Planctomycetota bacterium]